MINQYDFVRVFIFLLSKRFLIIQKIYCILYSHEENIRVTLSLYINLLHGFHIQKTLNTIFLFVVTSYQFLLYRSITFLVSYLQLLITNFQLTIIYRNRTDTISLAVRWVYHCPCKLNTINSCFLVELCLSLAHLTNVNNIFRIICNTIIYKYLLHLFLNFNKCSSIRYFNSSL